MEEVRVVISRAEYEHYAKLECKYNMIMRIAEKDKSQYGYSSETAKMIDAILDIDRKENK